MTSSPDFGFRHLFIFLLFTRLVLLPGNGCAQDSTAIHKARLRTIALAGTGAYVASMVGLSEVWYKEQGRSSFRFFNDNRSWQQIDKAGHAYSAYQISRLSTPLYQWAGISRKKSVWLGSLTSLLVMTPIEVFDGFSSGYGASWGDMIANTAGAALHLQNLWWEQPRIHLKFSFHRTSFAPLRPGTLGNTLPQEILKDYNGHSYWVSFDIQPWLGRESRFPGWLALALGYGASNMLYSEAEVNRALGFDTHRQYYLALDVNFTRIPTRSRFLRHVFFLLNTVRIPAPALEYNRLRGWTFHPLYF